MDDYLEIKYICLGDI